MFCRPDCSARLDFLRHRHRPSYVVHQENTSCPLGRNGQKKEELMHKIIDPTLPITKTPPTENVLFQPWKYHANTYLKKKILFSTWKKKTEVLCCPEKRKNKNPMHLKNLDWKIARHPSRQQLWSRRMIIISARKPFAGGWEKSPFVWFRTIQ